MNSRIDSNRVVRVIYLTLIIALTTISLNSVAQSISKTAASYKGLKVNFGTRTFKINSSIPQIDQTFVLQMGGQIGLIFGGKVFKSKIGLLGYYSSVNGIKGTIDALDANIAINFHPLGLILNARPRLEPYVIGQLAYQKTKFYGHYLSDDAGQINHSTSEPPYLGNTNQVTGSIGAGLQFKIIDKYDFIHLFTEVHFDHNISNHTNKVEFESTSIVQPIEMNIGVSFGAHRKKSI